MSIVIKKIGKKRYAYHAYRVGNRVAQRYLGNIADREVAAKIEKLMTERRVPRQFYPLFWDIDPGSLDSRRNARYIIERVLELGDVAAFRWAQMLYPTRLIAEVCATSRKVSEKSRNFWEIWMGVHDASECFRKKKAPSFKLADAAALEIMAISQRGAKRDFVDLYFILRKIPFRKIAENMVARFGADRLNPAHIGKSLAYFHDAESDPDPQYCKRKKTDWRVIKDFFVRHVQQMVLDFEDARKT